MAKEYAVAVVGAGMVGKKMVEILLERNFPMKSLTILATRERRETIAGREFNVRVADERAFQGTDIAFFAGTEGEKGAGKAFARAAVAAGSLVIDNGADFRMEPEVPLVIPEVNPHHLSQDRRLIANPNCSTIQMVVALAPIHREFKLQAVIASTYQAVSGTGSKAADELREQITAIERKTAVINNIYPRQIAFNLIPHIGSLSAEYPGSYTEEVKMIHETRKILDCPRLPVSATCVRVPVYNAHSETVTVQCEREPDAGRVRELLAGSPGIRVMDDPAAGIYPVPLDCSGKDEVFVGRIRKNTCMDRAIDLWIVADNIRKGAALNAVQIAEEILRRNYI